MEPRNPMQEKEALVEFVGVLNTLELAALIHKHSPFPMKELRNCGRRMLPRIKYTTNYICVQRVIESPLPDAEIKTLWKPINANGGVNVVLNYETELRFSTGY